MFVVRRAIPDDHAGLTKLTRLGAGRGLPIDPDELARRITVSRESFAGRVNARAERRFIFVLEDTDAGSVAGATWLSGDGSTAERPQVYLALRKREHYSEDLQTGHVHMTLELQTDPRAACDFGPIVLAPPYQGHREGLDAQLGLARLHYIGLHPESFADRFTAALPAPPMPDRRDAWWEHLGRRFVNLPRAEAAAFHDRSSEFMTALFPAGEIYVSLLPASARSLIGKVAEPARAACGLLEETGFRHDGRIEPFGGGPVYEAARADVPLIAATRWVTVGDPAAEYPNAGLVSTAGTGTFRMIRAQYADHADRISIRGEAAGLLDAQVGDSVGVTALEPP